MLSEIFFASEALAWAEVFEVKAHKILALVGVLCQIFLPLWYSVMWREWITIGLSVGIGVTPVFSFSCVEHALPPMANAAVAFFQVVPPAYHCIKKELPTEAIVLEEFNGMLTLFYLCVGVAPKADAVAIKPLDFCEKLRKLIGDKASVQSLVKVNTIASLDYLVKLLYSVVTSSKDVVVHKHQVVAAVDGYLIDIHVGHYPAFLDWYDTPGTFVWATSCEETIGIVSWYLRVDRVVGLCAVDFVGEP